MQSLEIDELEKLVNKIEKLVDEMPDRRRKLHDKLSERLKARVDAEIAVSINDEHGKIRAWQEARVGSGGGYAAVRPTDKGTGANSPGAITNYLENGHNVRPSLVGANYRSRINMIQTKERTIGHGSSRKKVNVPFVPGREFYAAVRGKILNEVMGTCEEFCRDIAKELNA